MITPVDNHYQRQVETTPVFVLVLLRWQRTKTIMMTRQTTTIATSRIIISFVESSESNRVRFHPDDFVDASFDPAIITTSSAKYYKIMFRGINDKVYIYVVIVFRVFIYTQEDVNSSLQPADNGR